jgi:hypothetical protein
LPQEEPAGQNPPDGAMIDYYLTDTRQEVAIEIRDLKNKLIRKYSNRDTLYTIPANNVPSYWIRPQQIVSGEKGSHRFLWDMHYQPLNEPPSYPIAATFMNTVPNATSPWVMPGTYTVCLMVDGDTMKQSITVRMDPRVTTSVLDLQKQHDLSVQCHQGKIQCRNLMKEVNEYRGPSTLKASGADENKKVIVDEETKRRNEVSSSLGRLSDSFSAIMDILQESDRPPTSQVILAVNETQKELNNFQLKWIGIKSRSK